MATLLNIGGYPYGSAGIFRLTNIGEDIETESVRIYISGLYDGMGYLNDLISYKDGKMLIEENRERYQLKVDIKSSLQK